MSDRPPTGIAIPEFVKLGWAVTSIDVSEDQLRVAWESLADASVELITADAEQLPFSDGSFDAVVSVLTRTDFEDNSGVLKEVYRVLRLCGRFIYVGTHPCT